MYKLYFANRNYSSWSLRPWVLLRELGIPFEEAFSPFQSCDFRDFSPTGKVPCLHDEECIVWDSLAIVEYVAEAHPRVWPSCREARAWARSAAAEMHAGLRALRVNCPMICGARVRLKTIDADLQQDIERVDRLWNEGLQRFGGPFLAGAEFSAADAFFAPVAFRVQTYDLPLSAAAGAYAERLLALPAMREWYAEALREPWRHAQYEAAARENGVWLEDFRLKP